MKDRINALMKHMGMSQKEFADEICISPGTLSSIFSGRNNASLGTLNNIRERFPEVNMDWLMNGTGEMFLSSDVASTPNVSEETVRNGAPQQPASLPLQPGFAEHLSGAMQPTPRNQNFAPEGKIFDKPARKIAEIRVFYDDGTFETFSAKP